MTDDGGERGDRDGDRRDRDGDAARVHLRSPRTDELPEFLTGQLDVVPAGVEPDEPVDTDQEVDPDLLSTLLDLGVDEPEARKAILQDRVALVMSQQLLEDPRTLTVEEVSAKSGLSVERVFLLRSALGLPAETHFSKTDVRWAKLLAELLEVISLETVLRSARARGNSLMAIVNSDLGVVRDELILPLRQAGADDITVGIALAEAVKAIDPTSRELLTATYSLQLRHMLSTELAATAARGQTSQIRAAVGFVDIVGYTRLSSRIDPSGLDALIDAFERRVVEVTSARRDVGVVKYLGDAVMLVAPDAVTMAEAMFELATEVESLADAPVRGAMAVGDVLARDGDYFGPTVNLAARLTDVTRPWRVLVAEDDIPEVRTRWKVDRIRPLRLRGIGTTRPGSIRRAWDEGELAELALKQRYEDEVEASATAREDDRDA